MKIEFETIPHGEQRYPTVGDYYESEPGVWQFRVSKMSDPRYEMLVFIHELVEWMWTQVFNVKEQDISDFDIEYEKNRKEGDTSEPGDDPKAPYFYGHQIATLVERVAAQVFGVTWQDYEKEVNSL